MATKRNFQEDPIVVTLTIQLYVYADMSDADIKDALPVDDSDFQEDCFGLATNGINDCGLNAVTLDIKR